MAYFDSTPLSSNVVATIIVSRYEIYKVFQDVIRTSISNFIKEALLKKKNLINRLVASRRIAKMSILMKRG